MRWILPLLLVPGPTLAWEFSPTPICTHSHRGDAGEVVITFDPSLPEYAIAVTLAEGTWPDAPLFAIAFVGAAELTITTDRHAVSENGRTVTVRDRGFGNVLNGLAFNSVAVAIAGETSMPLDLEAATEPVREFRDCPTAALS